ncbi:MAG: hypothetical protein JSS39_14000, partial [Nitrospira sp.]|nr:hypothetical protein [Nitrospira sp.]
TPKDDTSPEISFKAFAVALGLHAKLEGKSGREYLGGFVGRPLDKLGPPTGTGIVYYFGPDGERQSATITADMSALITDGVYVRLHGMWNGTKVSSESIGGIAEKYFGHALETMGLRLQR